MSMIATIPLSTRLRHFNPLWYFERAVLRYARNKVRSGRWEDLGLNSDTRFNIMLAADALYDMVASIRSDESLEEMSGGPFIPFLKGFAWKLANYAATTARYTPKDEALKQLGQILWTYRSDPASAHAAEMLDQPLALGFDIKPWIKEPGS